MSKGYSAIVIGQLGVDGKNSVSRKDFEEELVDFRLGQMANYTLSIVSNCTVHALVDLVKPICH